MSNLKTAVVLDENGNFLAEETGDDTNVWIIGIDELIIRIEELLTKLWLRSNLTIIKILNFIFLIKKS